MNTQRDTFGALLATKAATLNARILANELTRDEYNVSCAGADDRFVCNHVNHLLQRKLVRLTRTHVVSAR